MELQQKMFKLVEQWKLSNSTKSEFSVLHNVSYHSLNYWIKKYNKFHAPLNLESSSEENSLSFFSLPQSTSKSKDKLKTKNVSDLIKRLEIELGSGIKITIY